MSEVTKQYEDSDIIRDRKAMRKLIRYERRAFGHSRTAKSIYQDQNSEESHLLYDGLLNR